MVVNDGTLAGIESAILGYFNERSDTDAVYLFGSTAAGTSRPESDIDIAVLFSDATRCDGMFIIQMRQDLSDLFHRDVDLVCLNDAGPILRMQVLKRGKKLLDRNPRVLVRFIARTLIEYDDLKRTRKPIEEQLLRGRIYG